MIKSKVTFIALITYFIKNIKYFTKFIIFLENSFSVFSNFSINGCGLLILLPQLLTVTGLAVFILLFISSNIALKSLVILLSPLISSSSPFASFSGLPSSELFFVPYNVCIGLLQCEFAFPTHCVMASIQIF